MADIHWIYRASPRRERVVDSGWKPVPKPAGTGFTLGGLVLTAGKEAFAEGSSEDAVYKVEDGRLGIWIGDRLVAVLGPGAIAGAAAVLLQTPHLYTAKHHPSSSPVTVLSKYDGYALRNAFSQDPDDHERAGLGDLVETVAAALDAEAAAIENGILEATSDPASRVGRVRAFAKDRAERVVERIGQVLR